MAEDSLNVGVVWGNYDNDGTGCYPVYLWLRGASGANEQNKELKFEVLGREVVLLITDSNRKEVRETLCKPGAGPFVSQMVIAAGTSHAGGITGQGRSREAVVAKIGEVEPHVAGRP
jgi:hypothetical protein